MIHLGLQKSSIETEKKSNATFKPKIFSYCQGKVDKKNNGGWTQKEARQYIKFICSNIKTFQNEKKRRKRRIFEKMAEKLQTRNATQCRSHHQKMEKAFKGTKGIIDHFYGKKDQKIDIVKIEEDSYFQVNYKLSETNQTQVTQAHLDSELSGQLESQPNDAYVSPDLKNHPSNVELEIFQVVQDCPFQQSLFETLL